MISFKQSAVINAPVEKVFAVVADPNKIPDWRNGVPGVSQISGEARTGATFLEEVHMMGTHRLMMKVTDFVPNKKIVIEAQSGMPMLPAQSFTFTAEGTKTRIDLSVLMKTSGFLTMMEFMLPAEMKKTWEQYFVNLDRLVSK